MMLRWLTLGLVFVGMSSSLDATPPAALDLSGYQPVPYVRLTHPDWTKNATLYELNTRQFSPEGTFRAAERELPRLRDLNVSIIWLMPIHEIGAKNRKGLLGSPYAVRDYYSVNPEFGSLDDLKHFVATAHALGLHVIIDWVGNHTAWDNVLVSSHPDWYERDWKGNFCPTPWWDWSDIIDLDYTKPGLRKYMTDAMKYWVREVDIDGFRCDAAGFIPLDFWNNARKELDAIKPVFMLAEWETRDLHAEAFDATYAWSWFDAVRSVESGKSDIGTLFTYYSWNERSFPKDSMRMTFVTNHDKNSWEGTEFEMFGPGLDAAIALSVVGDGIPLLYNGQEAGNTRRLKFFERDPILWGKSPYAGLYRTLFALKRKNTALWNGHWGATMVSVPNDAKDPVLSFVRQNASDKVFAVFNLSGNPQRVGLKDTLYVGTYTDALSGEPVTLGEGAELALPPWAFRLYVR